MPILLHADQQQGPLPPFVREMTARIGPETYVRRQRVIGERQDSRNLLRAAVAELMAYRETPRAVVINEALEIARKFSSPESVHFVNGVLDSVGKELEGSSQITG